MNIGYFEHVMPVSHLSAHHAQCLKPLNCRCKHNKTFFPKRYFTFLCNETTSKFILKQLDKYNFEVMEILFDLNVYTRAHSSLRAQITSNSNFYRYVPRTIHSCFLPLMKRQQPRNVWSFTYFPRKKVYLLVSLLTSDVQLCEVPAADQPSEL